MSCKGIKLDHLALCHKERVHWTDNKSIIILIGFARDFSHYKFRGGVSTLGVMH